MKQGNTAFANEVAVAKGGGLYPRLVRCSTTSPQTTLPLLSTTGILAAVQERKTNARVWNIFASDEAHPASQGMLPIAKGSIARIHSLVVERCDL